MTDLQKKNLNKILKLLSMTEANGCSAHEAEVAKSQAEKLMAKHNIDDNDIENSEIDYDAELYLMIDDEDVYLKIPVWRKILLQYVSRAFGVSITFSRDVDGDDIFIRSGTEVDIEVADYCDMHIAKQMMELADEYRIENGFKRNSKNVTSFLRTMTNEVISNLKDVIGGITSPGKTKTMYEEASERTEKALAVYCEATGAQIRTTRSRSTHNSAGARAAGNVSVNGAVGGSRSAPARIGA